MWSGDTSKTVSFGSGPSSASGSRSVASSSGAAHAPTSGGFGWNGTSQSQSEDEEEHDTSPPSKKSRNEEKVAVEIADKSCVRCRERKVRCDRTFPVCKRCKKRKESCAFPKGVSLELADEQDDSRKVERLERKLASLEAKLQAASRSQTQSQSPPEPSVSPFSSLISQSQSTLPFSSDIVTPTSPTLTLPEMIYVAVTKDTDLSNIGAVYYYLAEELERRREEAGLGKGKGRAPSMMGDERLRNGLEWKLGRMELSRELRRTLIQQSRKACCSRIPAFATLKARIDKIEAQFTTFPTGQKRTREILEDEEDHEQLDDATLNGLDASTKVAVVVLCCLGARSSPHSAILGVACEPNSPPDLVLTAGIRRQKACHSLSELVIELCQKSGILFQSEPGWEKEGLEGLCGVIQLLLYSDVRPTRARYVFRNALGVYLELKDSKAMRQDPQKWESIKDSLGHFLYESDAIISAQLSLPPLIATAIAFEFFSTSPNAAFHLPDLSHSSLSTDLGKILATGTGVLTKDIISECLWTAAAWVCAISREFANASTNRSPHAPSPLPTIASLWTSLDTLHTTIQQLQQLLVSVNYLPSGCTSEDEVQDFVLLGVRLDTRVVDLIGLIDGYLEDYEGAKDDRCRTMKRESELRLRKCLKLMAFYAQLYLHSRDPHIVYHLFMQANLIRDWTKLCVQRVGDPGGPSSAEYEVSDEELTWLKDALRLACFYCPRANAKLAELSARESSQKPVEQVVCPIPLKPTPQAVLQASSASDQPSQFSFDDTNLNNFLPENGQYDPNLPLPTDFTPNSFPYQTSFDQFDLPPFRTGTPDFSGGGNIYDNFEGRNWMDFALEDLESGAGYGGVKDGQSWEEV